MANLRNALTLFIGRFRRGRLAQYGISNRRMRRRASRSLQRPSRLVDREYAPDAGYLLKELLGQAMPRAATYLSPTVVTSRIWAFTNSFAGVRFVTDAGCGHRSQVFQDPPLFEFGNVTGLEVFAKPGKTSKVILSLRIPFRRQRTEPELQNQSTPLKTTVSCSRS